MSQCNEQDNNASADKESGAISWEKARINQSWQLYGRVGCVALFVIEPVISDSEERQCKLSNWFLSENAITKTSVEDLKRVAEQRLKAFLAAACLVHAHDVDEVVV